MQDILYRITQLIGRVSQEALDKAETEEDTEATLALCKLWKQYLTGDISEH